MTYPKAIHHMNCGTLRLPGSPMVCHVLLLEYPDHLVLVDTGFGLADITDAPRRIGAVRSILRPMLDPEETAIRQLQRLGFAPSDVTHIILTHMDIDHAGGLSDFPDAIVHVTSDEARGAVHAPNRFEQRRYNKRMWRDRKIVERMPGSIDWFGFEGTSTLDDVAPGALLVPLPGHTRGHAGLALNTAQGWLLHAGDAFYYECSIGGPGRLPLAARIQERLVAFDMNDVRDNQRRLARLRSEHASEVAIICSHDPQLFLRVTAQPGTR